VSEPSPSSPSLHLDVGQTMAHKGCNTLSIQYEPQSLVLSCTSHLLQMTDNMVQAREKAAVAAAAAVHSEPPACAEAPTPAPCAGAPPPTEQGEECANGEAKPSANSTSPSRRGAQESAVGAPTSDRKRAPEREGARLEGETENMPDAKRSRSSDP